MTVVLDAFAVIATLTGEPAAAVVETEFRQPGAEIIISSVNLAEVIDKLLRRHHVSASDADEKLWLLAAAGLRVANSDESVGRLTGQLRARYYDRKSAPLSLADCVALATCIQLKAQLATADPALAEVARKEGQDVVPLPDSGGRLPLR